MPVIEFRNMDNQTPLNTSVLTFFKKLMDEIMRLEESLARKIEQIKKLEQRLEYYSNSDHMWHRSYLRVVFMLTEEQLKREQDIMDCHYNIQRGDGD